MAHQPGRLLAIAAAVAVAAGCGGGQTAAQSATATPITSHARNTEARPEMTGPRATELVNNLTGFVSPSGNVACMLDANWARCDIIDRDWSPPARPADCEFDFGQGISLASGGQAAFVCAGDTVFGPDAVLAYGDSVTAGALRCESSESGITCRDTNTAHGFAISREAYRLF